MNAPISIGKVGIQFQNATFLLRDKETREQIAKHNLKKEYTGGRIYLYRATFWKPAEANLERWLVIPDLASNGLPLAEWKTAWDNLLVEVFLHDSRAIESWEEITSLLK